MSRFSTAPCFTFGTPFTPEFGFFQNRDFRPDTTGINVGIFCHSVPTRFFFGVGGNSFQRVAKNSSLDYRISEENIDAVIKDLESILERHPERGGLSFIAIINHGNVAKPYFKDDLIPFRFYDFICKNANRSSKEPPTICFVECSIAKGKVGKNFCQNLADDFNLIILASDEGVILHAFNSDKFCKFTPRKEKESNFH